MEKYHSLLRDQRRYRMLRDGAWFTADGRFIEFPKLKVKEIAPTMQETVNGAIDGADELQEFPRELAKAR